MTTNDMNYKLGDARKEAKGNEKANQEKPARTAWDEPQIHMLEAGDIPVYLYPFATPKGD